MYLQSGSLKEKGEKKKKLRLTSFAQKQETPSTHLTLQKIMLSDRKSPYLRKEDSQCL